MQDSYEFDEPFERITIEPGKMGGRPCVRGLRVTVAQIVDMVAAGMTPDEIVGELPWLEREDVRQALRYAAALARRQPERAAS